MRACVRACVCVHACMHACVCLCVHVFVLTCKCACVRSNTYSFLTKLYRSSPWLVEPNCANKLSTQLKAPYTSTECKILDVILKPLTFAGNSAFLGAAWGPLRILHPLWQGKGTFLNLLRSTSASKYTHYKFHLTMLQCRI